jgi:hypothetical protein
MSKKEPTEGLPRTTRNNEAAVAARLSLGSTTDSAVIGVIRQHPGISAYEISKLLRFNPGRVDGSVSRLQASGEIVTRYVLHEGRLTKEIFPKGFLPEKPKEISIDMDLLNSPAKWSSEVNVYALDRATIGISPDEIDEWNSKALVKERMQVSRNDGKLVVALSEKLLDFYIWENSSAEVSVVGDKALVTLKTIIPLQSRGELNIRSSESPDNFSNFFISFGRETKFAGTSPRKPILLQKKEETEGTEVLLIPMVKE